MSGYGLGGYGESAYAGAQFTPLDDPDWLAWLAEPAVPRCWLLELEAYSLAAATGFSGAYGDSGYGVTALAGDLDAAAGGLTEFRFSTHGFTSGASDSPASTHYEARIGEGIRFERNATGQLLGGLSRELLCEVHLTNTDGGLDDLLQHYAVEGRSAVLRVGPPDGARADFGLAFDGVVSRVAAGYDTVIVSLTRGEVPLDQTLQTAFYAGSGGTEGGDDLKNLPKPLAFGRGMNVPAPLVDATNLIYQVHAGAVEDIPFCTDRGIALTKVTGAPASGEYQPDLTAGTAKLGATPDGQVTFNVKGLKSGGVYQQRLGQLLRAVIQTYGGLPSGRVDASRLDTLDAALPYELGIWFGTETVRVADALEELLKGAVCVAGFNRRGLFDARLVRGPGPGVDLELDSADIETLTREPLPADLEPAVWRVAVACQHLERVQTDLAAGATAARRALTAVADRFAVAEDTDIRTTQGRAKSLEIPGRFALTGAGPQGLADELLAWWGGTPRRALYRVRCLGLRAMTLEVGDTVQITYPRHHLDDGKLGLVMGVAVDGAADRVELRVLA